MQKQIVFLIVLLLTLGVFTYTSIRIARFFRLTKPAFRVRNTGKRISETMKVAFGQSKMFRLPVV
ncbi:MAG TPA: hypothetical protein VJ877_03055, partial [Bacteroidales bacterium]|nr:hypothetical protein [Bacteroidales bacterium]